MTSLVFTSEVAAIVFAAAVIAFFVCEQVGGVIIPSMRRNGAKVQRKNAGSNLLVLFSWVAVFGFSVSFAAMGTIALSNWVFFIGIALMVAGTVFRQWAIAVLGRYFSGVLGVQSEQKVVEAGPYRWIRHPSYTGVLLFLVGWGLALQSGAALLVNVVIFAVAYGFRIMVEERILVKEFGNNYIEYMKRTKRLIPRLV